MFHIIILATIICVFVYFFNREITTRELLCTLGITISTVLIVYTISIIPFHNDEYFASGRLIETRYYPEWVEKYQQSHTMCTGSGKVQSCHVYYTTEYDTHEKYWTVHDSLGQSWEVDSKLHAQVKSYFGNIVTITKPDKSTHGGDLVKGDPNLYTYKNVNNIYKYPTTKK